MTCDLKTATLEELRKQAEPLGSSCKDRDRLFAAALDLTADDQELALLTVAQRFIRENRHTELPVERFVTEVLEWALYRPPTLKCLKDKFENLETDWDAAVAVGRKFYREHRELITEPAGDPEGESDGGDNDN